MNSEVAIFLFIFCNVLIGYLIGSIMTSDIVGHFIKSSARYQWSKNPGTTNSIRVYGKKLGLVVGIFDILKGFFAFLICWSILEYGLKPYITEDHYDKIYYLVYLTNLMVIVGHCWPVFFKFKGGKAAAPTAGLLISVSYWWLIIIVVVWWTTLFISKYVSLSTLISGALLPIINLINPLDHLNFFMLDNPLEFLTYQNDWHIILFLELVMMAVCAIIFWRHRANIVRLINHNENRIGKKK